MKRYKFRFEPLLFQRQTLEELTQQELGREHARLTALQQQLEATFRRYQTHIKTRPQSGMTPAEMQLHTNYTSVLYENLEAAKEKVRQQRKIVQQLRERLTRQHIDTKVVETLKEKDHERYKVEEKRSETRQMDEFISIRHNLGSAEKKRN